MQPLADLTIYGFGFRPAIKTIVSAGCKAFDVGEKKFFDDPFDLWEALKQSDPDILFLETNGQENDPAIEILHRIRHHNESRNPYLPLIAVSPHRSKRDVMNAIDAGFHEYLVLPLTGQRLWTAMTNTVFLGRPFVRTKDYFGPCRRRRADLSYTGEERRKEGSQAARQNQEERMAKIASSWKAAS